MASKILLVLMFSLVCVALLVSADSTEEQEREAIHESMEEARDTFAKALRRRGFDHYASLQRRGFWSDTWNSIKTAASDYWHEHKNDIITTGIGAILSGKRDE